jgi:hypothetical protein
VSTESIDKRVTVARGQLESTLDELEDRFNVPKQVSKLSGKAKSAYESNPVPWIIGATATAIVVVGVVAWALFSDD